MFARLRSLLDGLVQRDRVEREMAEEMRFHMHAYVDDLVRSGVPRADAERRARIEFGAVEAVKEECRESRGLQFADELRQDLRYTARQMAKSPGFTAAAIVSLALGIGANTAIFSLMDAVLFRTLPITNPQQLFFLGHGDGPDVTTSANYPLFERYQKADVLSGVTSYTDRTFMVRTPEGIERVYGQYVSGNYHAVLGVPLVAGRGFSTESDRDVGAAPIAVISDAYWNRRFGRNADAIGSLLTIGERAVTIVGVTTPSFHGLMSGAQVDITLPMSVRALDETKFFDERDGWTSLPIVGRLKPGVSEGQALRAINVIFRRFWLEPENAWARGAPYGDARSAALLPAAKGSGELRQRYTNPLRVLMGMVGIVLLIACANVANLLLARAAARAREVAVRMGLGASRRRLLRQFLTESLVLASLAGALGLLVAFWSTHAVLSLLNSGPNTLVVDVSLNARVLVFTLGASILTGIGFGVMPAFTATRVELTNVLKGSADVGHRRARPVGKALLVGQIALCVLVVAAAGLLVRSLHNLKAFDTGFTRDNVLLFNVETTGRAFTPERRAAFYPELLARLHQLPGVQSASLADRSPLDFSGQSRKIEVPGFAEPPGPRGVSSVAVTPEYFQTFGIGLVRGRLFTDQDRRGASRVALVNESMARAYFGAADPLDRTIVLGGRKDAITVVGVVRDVRHEALRVAAPRSVYTALAQPGEAFDGSDGMPERLTAMVRTVGDPRLTIGRVPELVRELHRDAVISYVRTMDEQLNAALVSERLLASLSSGFAVLALLLAAVGLYGVMSYSVARRTRDTGIRMALGATQRAVLWRVLRETIALSGTGVAIGLGVTVVTTRVVSAFLFELSPNDPLTLTGVAAILLTTALVAGLVPARRAAAVDPIRAIKAE